VGAGGCGWVRVGAGGCGWVEVPGSLDAAPGGWVKIENVLNKITYTHPPGGGHCRGGLKYEPRHTHADSGRGRGLVQWDATACGRIEASWRGGWKTKNE
jgi:hypothetical protein